MSNENHPCGSLAASFEIIVFDFEIRKRDRNNERCLSSFYHTRLSGGEGIVRENPVPLKGIREADCTELPPTTNDHNRFLECVKGKSSITEEVVTVDSGDWQVENCLHFVKDRWWVEDRHWTKRPGLAPVFASLTNAAVSVLRLLSGAEKIQWNPKNILKTLELK